MNTMILGSITLAQTQYDEVRPKRLNETEVLQLFAALYDETMPLAYVEAVEAIFAHIKACQDCIEQGGCFANVRVYDYALTPAEVEAIYAS